MHKRDTISVSDVCLNPLLTDLQFMNYVLYLAPQVLSPSRRSCPPSDRILMYCHTLQADRENNIKLIIVSDVDEKRLET